jgi:hypothetical protein
MTSEHATYVFLPNLKGEYLLKTLMENARSEKSNLKSKMSDLS